MSDELKRIVRALGAQIQIDIQNINGEIVALEPLEEQINNNNLEGCVRVLHNLTEYKAVLISQENDN